MYEIDLKSQPARHLRQALLDLSSTRLVSSDVDLPMFEMHLGCLFAPDVQVVESDGVVEKPVDASSFANSDPPPLLEEIVDFIVEKIKYYVTLLTSEKLVFSIKGYARALQNTVFYMKESECLVSALLRLYHVPDVICGLNALDDFCRVVGKLVYMHRMLNDKSKSLLEGMKELKKWGDKQEELSFTFTLKFRWFKPAFGWCKLNTDGSRNSDLGCIGGGGVIRNSEGNWIKGFAANFGVGTVLQAEAKALAFGLRMASQNRPVLTQVEIETDSAILVQLMKSEEEDIPIQLRPTIADCKRFLLCFECYTLEHVYREQNNVADRLAKRGLEVNGLLRFRECPDFVKASLKSDIDGIPTPRNMPKHMRRNLL